MGIPSFYRWLTGRFPLTVVDAVDVPLQPGDAAEPNPNGLDFDNLYLDMNGIVHPCFHPEEGACPQPKNYDQVFQGVFTYIDKLVSIVRPRKLLYLAIDGVAPRAKMNQQRTRRFRTAKEAEEEVVPKQGNRKDKFDSNVITPGTEYMAMLSSALRYYIQLRMNKGGSLWSSLKVILSDSSVPGEGEHKIMSYIRLQRNLPGYDPNTRHCLYGLDADLIMLALASHEIHFSILREDLQNKFGEKPKPSQERSSNEEASLETQKTNRMGRYLERFSMQNFQFVHIWILREYLAYEMKIPDRTVKGDLERFIDDFVFMCLFVGNDFLPHVPSLEISEGAIDLLMATYKKEFVNMGGYLTNSFEVNLARVKHFLQVVGSHECLILSKRLEIENKRRQHGRFSKKRKKPVAVSVNSSSMKKEATEGSSSIKTNEYFDKIKYGQEGWKERYYAVKFDAETVEDRQRIMSDVVLKYTEGICWVMHYYYQGVCSWQWFYPYHYAPMASDFCDIDMLKIQFTLGEPFKPFDQLMAVLPPLSAHALPLSYQKLMTDALSPLAPFYPTDFELDMNGKDVSWKAICKLPFIEESLLLSEIARVEHTLTDEESLRNSLGLAALFIYCKHPLAMEIVSTYGSVTDHPQSSVAKIKHEVNPKLSGGMNGYILISDKPVLPAVITSPVREMENIRNNQVLSMFYDLPPSHLHITRPPEGVQFPTKTISKKDIQPTPRLWHEGSAAVGQLHSMRSIPYSISGHRLAKVARQLVSGWYLEGAKKRMHFLEHDVVASANGNTENTNTVTPVDALGVGEAIGSEHHDIKSTLKRKRKRARKASNKTSSASMQTPVTMALVPNLGDATSAVMDDSTCQLHINQVCGDNDPDVSFCHLNSEKRSLACNDAQCAKTIAVVSRDPVKDTEEGNVVPVNNVIGGDLFCPSSKLTVDVGTETAGNTGGQCDSKSKKKRRRKIARLARREVDNQLGMMSSTAGETPVTSVLTSSLGDVTIALMNESTCQRGGNKKSINGEAGQPTIQNDHSGEDALSCHLNFEKSIAGEARGEKTVAFVSRNLVKDNGEGNIAPENNVGGGELMCSSSAKATGIGRIEPTENKGDPGSVCKSEKKRKRKSKKTRLESDDIVNDLGKMNSNLGVTTSALVGESTGQSQVDQTGGDKNKINGEVGKSLIPDDRTGADVLPCHLNLETRSLAGEVQPEKTKAAVFTDPVKNQDKGNAFPEKNLRGYEFMCSGSAGAIDVGRTEINGNPGEKGEVSKSKKKSRRKKARLGGITVENVGTIGADAKQPHVIPVCPGVAGA